MLRRHVPVPKRQRIEHVSTSSHTFISFSKRVFINFCMHLRVPRYSNFWDELTVRTPRLTNVPDFKNAPLIGLAEGNCSFSDYVLASRVSRPRTTLATQARPPFHKSRWL